MLPHEEKDYSFSTVRLAVEGRLNHLLNVQPNSKEIELLRHLEATISAFEHIQKRWISGSGILADYYKTDLLNEITENENKFRNINQEQLLADSIKSIKEGAEFAVLMAQKMIILLHDPENAALLDPNLFKTIEKSITSAKESAKQTYQIASRLTVDKILSDAIFTFANALGGRFMFSRQGLDPIHGADRFGLCYGYVMDWANEITHTGKYLSQPRSNKATVIEQQRHLKEEWDNAFLRLPCKSTREIWQNIDSLLAQIDTSSIYLLSYYSNSNQDGHAMGLRKCHNGEIEFFDPNFGLFVFPNSNIFRIWVNELFSNYLKLSDDFNIKLAHIGNQPLDSVPTIPSFSITISDEDKYSHITHQYNLKYLNTMLTLPNFKKSIKEINDINKVNIDLDDIQINPTYDNTHVKQSNRSIFSNLSKINFLCMLYLH